MNTTLFSIKTDTYLSAEWSGSRCPWGPRRTEPFITISREAGSGGSSLARLLARKLNGGLRPEANWCVYETNLAPKMLRTHHLPAHFARFLPEDRVSEFTACIGEMIGRHPSLWDLVQKTNETVRRLAAGGQAILVGRGANFATKGMAGGIHVRLVAPAGHRARYLADLYNLSESEALALNAKCDAARRSYVRATFSEDVEDPTAYDLVINTAQMPLADIAALVTEHVRLRMAAPH